MQTERLKITGMSCGDCSSRVTKALKAVNGVEDVFVSLASAEATVQYDEQLTATEQLKLAVKEAGYGIDKSNVIEETQAKGCCG